ncbi:uncharacterized protein LOC135500372 isoform X2 [Lineus longissimus]|uniref:uncharacterized protein LOC135500372 isoform X2 n=1 Tax=Lineus longissimus TaxID=88925 RepID=UPI00315C5D08
MWMRTNHRSVVEPVTDEDTDALMTRTETNSDQTMTKYRDLQYIFVRGILVCILISFALMAAHMNAMTDTYEEYVPNAPPPYLKPKFRKLNAKPLDGKYCTIYGVSKELVAPEFSCTALNGISESANICIHSPWLDKYISKKVFERGTFEPHLTLPFQYIMSADDSLSLIDIGANIGVYTLFAAMLDRKVVAVEPLYDNMARLHKAIKLNKYEDRITLVMNAVSNVRKVVNLTRDFNEKNYGHTYIKEKSMADGVDFMSLQEVDTVYLDDLLEVIDFKKAILKIDIEGQEVKAFTHASELFKTVDIPYVFMEWKWIKNLNRITFLKNFFYTRGYKPFNRPIGGTELKGDSLKWPFNVIWIRNATKLPKNIEDAYSDPNAAGWF